MALPREPELSEILSNLADHSRRMEETFSDMAEMNDAAVAERRARAELAATTAVERMDRDVAAAEAGVAADWRALQSGIDKQVEAMKTDMAARKQAHDVRQAEERARAAKARASWAASYAVAAADVATAAEFDAEIARREADKIKRP